MMKTQKKNRTTAILRIFLNLSLAALIAPGCGGSKAKTIEEPPQPPPPLVLEQPQTEPEPIMPAEPEPEPASIPEPPPKPAFALATIHFDFDAFDLPDNALEQLRQNAEILRVYPETEIIIEGHCDERGTVEYNLALGDKRARAAKDYLMQLGVEESRISTISYGSEKPVNPEHNEIAWDENRRAEFARK